MRVPAPESTQAKCSAAPLSTDPTRMFSKISSPSLFLPGWGWGRRSSERLLFVAGRQNIPIIRFQREEHPPYFNHKTIKARRLAGSVVLFCSILFSPPSSETNRVVKLAFLGCGNVPMGCFQSCCILSFFVPTTKGSFLS